MGRNRLGRTPRLSTLLRRRRIEVRKRARTLLASHLRTQANQASGCRGKMKYSSAQAARAFAATAHARFKVYRCPKCRAWHVTTQT